MLTIPLYTVFFFYLAFLVIFVIFSLVNVYHIVASASFTLTSFFITFFIFALSILTLYFTIQLLLEVDWKTPMTVIDLNSVTSLFRPKSF